MKSTSPIRAMDLRLIDDLFEMGGGYVLDFTNQTFSQFFADEIGVNINDPRYATEGSSKAKRLRLFLRLASPKLRVQTLQALWDYRAAIRRRSGTQETIPDAPEEFARLLRRLTPGSARARTTEQPPRRALDPAISEKLKAQLLEVAQLEPQSRGYAFERFLKELFDAHGLSARASFRLVGEQIDGSFEFQGETYLLEARWRNALADASDLRSFDGKVARKAAWSRGLFICYSGFSADGLLAFGPGNHLVCMDGLDLNDMLEQSLSFADVMARKVRRAAEQGTPFVPLRELYP